MDLSVILMGIVVVILLYFLYVNYYSSSTALTTNSKLYLEDANPPIIYSSLTNKDSRRYAYGAWIYVNTWSSTGIKPILTRGSLLSTSTFTSGTDFSLWLDTITPTLYCNFAPLSSASKLNSNIPITSNFPLQKWTHVIVSVDDTIVDIYLDGKLVLSQKPVNGISTPTSDIIIGKGAKSTLDIYVALLNRWPQAMNPTTAWSSYTSGGSSLGTSSYNVQLALMKDQVQQQKYNII